MKNWTRDIIEGTLSLIGCALAYGAAAGLFAAVAVWTYRLLAGV